MALSYLKDWISSSWTSSKKMVLAGMLRNVIKFGLMPSRSSVCPKRKMSRSGSHPHPTHVHTKENSRWDKLQKELYWWERWGKTTALEHICEYASVNVMSKKICLFINSMTDSAGNVFRNIEPLRVTFTLIYMSNCYKATLPLSFLFQSQRESEINSTKKHMLSWVTLSFVF